jgi:hypothetical protein
VVSLRGIGLVTFLSKLSKLELWGTDIGNEYLEATTKEKVYITGGPEFGTLEGHTLVDYMVYDRLVFAGINDLPMFSDY